MADVDFNIFLILASLLIIAQSMHVGIKVLRCANQYRYWSTTTGTVLRSKARWERSDRSGLIFGFRGLGWFSACVLYS